MAQGVDRGGSLEVAAGLDFGIEAQPYWPPKARRSGPLGRRDSNYEGILIGMLCATRTTRSIAESETQQGCVTLVC
jgi:hypothetical protein